MGSYTPNHNLFLPNLEDNVDVDELNNNFTIIDTALAASVDTIRVVISNTTPDPNDLPSQYLWIQTGLSPGGTGFTFWLENGA